MCGTLWRACLSWAGSLSENNASLLFRVFFFQKIERLSRCTCVSILACFGPSHRLVVDRYDDKLPALGAQVLLAENAEELCWHPAVMGKVDDAIVNRHQYLPRYNRRSLLVGCDLVPRSMHPSLVPCDRHNQTVLERGPINQPINQNSVRVRTVRES